MKNSTNGVHCASGGLTLWVSDLFEGVAQIQCCHGCGVGQHLQSQYDLQPGELPYAADCSRKRKNKFQKDLDIFHLANVILCDKVVEVDQNQIVERHKLKNTLANVIPEVREKTQENPFQKEIRGRCLGDILKGKQEFDGVRITEAQKLFQ